jgi:hypothetical protein
LRRHDFSRYINDRLAADFACALAKYLSEHDAAPTILDSAEDGESLRPVASGLTVWYGSMPESNGKSNWTAILHRGDISDGFTIDRSEYPDRVRYEADRVRWLIGETAKEPCILDYDADKHSTYAPRDAKPSGKPAWVVDIDAIDGLFLQQATWTSELGYAINSDDFHYLLGKIREVAAPRLPNTTPSTQAVGEHEAGTLTHHDVQKKAIEYGFVYWRAPDAHGVSGTKPQAIELLQDLIGVEVEIEDNGCSTCDGTGMIGGPSFYEPDEGGEPCPDCSTAPTTGSAPVAEPLVFDDWFCNVYMVNKLPQDESMERRAAVAGWIAAHKHWGRSANPAASVLTELREILMDQAQPHLAVRMSDALKRIDALLAASMGGEKS